MDWNSIIEVVLPILLTFAIGYVANNPAYIKAKKLLKLASDALEDDKISKSEYKNFVDVISKKENSKEVKQAILKKIKK